MRIVASRVRSHATAVTLVVLLAVPSVFAEDVVPPYEPPAARINPPIGATSPARIDPPGGTPSEAEGGVLQSLIDWLLLLARIHPPTG